MKAPKTILLLSIFILLMILFADSIYQLTNKKDIEYNYPIESDDSDHLQKYGFCLVKGVLPLSDADKLKNLSESGEYETVKKQLHKNRQLLKTISDTTGSPDYQLQDYIWIIQKSAVHTCHRDNNGDFFNEGQQYPSYTMIVYLEDMDKCLSIIPESHTSPTSYYFNFTDSLRTVVCNKGDVIIFNANIVHVGTIIDGKDDHVRVQLKVTHKDDISKIAYYENFNKVLNLENTNPLSVRKLQRNLSCAFPGFSNLTQNENIRTARGSDEGVDIGYTQQIFSYLFYGNKDFYNLPNAFTN
jgi:hypothetical protein